MPNFLFLIADEYRKDALGCLGSPAITPNLDALAARGTLFTSAYTPSPMCVPARAALATGQPVFESEHWDSAKPYAGLPGNWMGQLREAGVPSVSIGKLHFRSADDDNGWSEEIMPMHVVGEGWAEAMLRDELPDYSASAAELAEDVGEGSSTYTDYDLAITEAAERWLGEQQAGGDPWALSLSWVSPHYPLTCPAEFLALYDEDSLSPPLPKPELPLHPALDTVRNFFCYDRYFDEPTRRRARAAYFGLCSFLDHQVGRVLTVLQARGLAEDTVVVFTSDHGEMLGDRGFWTKQTLYDSSVGVPMIVAGPDVGVARRDTPVSLLDIRPTALAATGVREDARARPGRDLRQLALAEDPEREVLAEYHDGGSTTGSFMLRWGRWKYVHHVGLAAQLFDMQADPTETHDLASDPAYAETLAEGERRLRGHCDPEAVDHTAQQDQRQRVVERGGREALLSAFRFNHTPTPQEQMKLAAE